ncbi:uncharacterized protein [Tursiops truncatus]|uniref:uncharacterized protein isoform X1 n=2 Tax=Tursiops truncatus TaxID=9739 RepID=UPI003CCF2B97
MGILISIFRRGHRKKAVMGARTSTTSRSSVSAVDTVTVSVARGQPVPATTPSCVPNYSTEKTVLRALGESGQGMAKQEEVPTVTGKNEDQRSGPNDTGGARSAFRPLGGSFFVPRPGPLKRDLHAKWAEDRSARKQQTSCMSSCPQRNAITSSYSSTRGFLPVKRRRGPAIPQGLPQKSAKTGGEEGPPSPSAAPVVSQRKSQPDKNAETARGQKGPWRKGSRTSDSPRPRKRRIPLLPHRRGEPLRLPPAPEPGFRVTAEDLDSEKEAAFRRINRALRGETYAIGDLGSSPQHRQPKTPAFASAPGPRASGGPAQASSGCSSSRNSTVGTHASTQLGFGSRAAALDDLSCMFAALRVTSRKRGPPSTTHSNGGSVGLNSWGPPHQSHPMVTTGPRPKKKPGFGGTTAPILMHIPGGPDWQLRGTTACGSSPQQRKRKAPAFASAPGPPPSGSPAQASSGCSSSRNSTVGTHASTQLGFGSRAAALDDLSCMFAALRVTSRKRGPPSTTHSNGGSVGLNSCGPPHQNHPMVTTGPRPKKKPGFGGTTAPILMHIPGGPDWQLRGTTACGSSPQQRKRKAPAFASAPGPPPSGSPAQASSGCSSSRNSTVGTHASTQLGFGSRAAALDDLSCMFAALRVTSRKRGPPSTTHSNGGSVGLNSWGPPHQSHPMVTTGPSPKKKPRFGGTAAPILHHIPGGAPRQGPPTSSGGCSPCPAKADFRGVSVPASIPISLSSTVGTARCSLALRAPSSPAQGLAGQKTTGPSTKSFSSRSRFITLGFKRRKLA